MGAVQRSCTECYLRMQKSGSQAEGRTAANIAALNKELEYRSASRNALFAANVAFR